MEILRVVLSEQDGFDPYGVFRELDEGAKGYITDDVVAEFLDHFGEDSTPE